MKNLNKPIAGIVVLVIIITIASHFLAKVILSDIKQEKESYEKYLGETYIINKDTLTIVDYSFLQETFTLSNGQKISKKLIEK